MGGYAVSAYSELLNLDRCLLLSPISSLNKKVAPFEKRFSFARDHLNWTSNYFDGAKTETPKLILFDPHLEQDKMHSIRFKNANLVKVRNVGHEVAKHLLELGVLKEVFISFVHYNKIKVDTLHKIKNNKKNYKPWLNNILNKNQKNKIRKKIIKEKIKKIL